MLVIGFSPRGTRTPKSRVILTNRPEDWESAWIFQAAFPEATLLTIEGRTVTGTCARCRCVEYQGDPILETCRKFRLCPDCR